MSRSTLTVVLALLVISPLGSGSSRAGTVRDEQAVRAEIRAFDAAFRDPDPVARAEAIRTLARRDHPAVARQLLSVAAAVRLPHSTRAEAVRSLSGQRASARAVASAVGRLLNVEAKRERKGLIDVVLDENRDVVTTTEEGARAVRLLRERGAFAEACARCLLEVGDWRAVDDDRLFDLLENGHDGLVIALLETFARREDWTALPAIHALFRIYPRERRWDVSHIVVKDRQNSDRAKLNYVRRFGDPGITRARPEVVKSIRATLEAISGETFETPEELGRFLKRNDVERRMKVRPRGRLRDQAAGG